MSRFMLYTYKNLAEFNEFYYNLEQQGKEIFPFIFERTMSLLEDEDNLTIDISSLIENLKQNPQNNLPAINNFRYLNETTQVIVREDLAALALEYIFPVFYEAVPLNAVDELIEQDEVINNISLKRKPLFHYENGIQLDKIIDYANDQEIPFANFSKLNGSLNNQFREWNRDGKRFLVDITSIVLAISSNPQIIYLTEQLLDTFSNYIACIRKDKANEAIDSFKLLFCETKPITELFNEIVATTNDVLEVKTAEKVKRIIDLDDASLNEFLCVFTSNLIGHNTFKEHFSKAVRNFIVLNRIGEKKVLSIFLLGASGLGKTEVARIIKSILNIDTSFTKINFGNFSSQDALNSLIGSPKGYIGCEDGELSQKIRKSKAGIILCDEFEKATRPIYNFFLELLEDGTFTDSMSREFDLNGYIIIFTSNLPDTKDFYKEIPPELRSRIDFVCKFDPLSVTQKKEYVKFQIDSYLKRLKNHSAVRALTSSEMINLQNINIEATDDLRNIKKMVELKVVEFLNSEYDMVNPTIHNQ